MRTMTTISLSELVHDDKSLPIGLCSSPSRHYQPNRNDKLNSHSHSSTHTHTSSHFNRMCLFVIGVVVALLLLLLLLLLLQEPMPMSLSIRAHCVCSTFACLPECESLIHPIHSWLLFLLLLPLLAVACKSVNAHWFQQFFSIVNNNKFI